VCHTHLHTHPRSQSSTLNTLTHTHSLALTLSHSHSHSLSLTHSLTLRFKLTSLEGLRYVNGHAVREMDLSKNALTQVKGVYIYTHTRACTGIYACACMWLCFSYIYRYIYRYIYMCVCVCVSLTQVWSNYVSALTLTLSLVHSPRYSKPLLGT